MWLTHKATAQSATNCFLLPNRNLNEAQSSTVLLWRPLWPSGTKGVKQYELFKFLLWRGSACERHCSKLRMAGKQQKRVTFLTSAYLCDWTCVWRNSLRAHCECSPEASVAATHSTHGHCKHVWPEVRRRERRMYLDAWGGEIWDLKLDADRWLPLLVLSLDARQAEVGSHQVLFSTLSGCKLSISYFELDTSHNRVTCKRGPLLTVVASDGVSSQGRTWLTRQSRCSRAPTWRCPL